MPLQQQIEREGGRLGNVRAALLTFRLVFGTVMLTLILTPIGIATALPKAQEDLWPWLTCVAYAIELASIVAAGRWAKRVGGVVTPWDARVAVALLFSVLPLAIALGTGWAREGKVGWATGSWLVAGGVLLHVAATFKRLAGRD